MRFDVLVVGAGPFGCACARTLADAGHAVLVVDRRDHVGGNAFDEEIDGVRLHRYGAHIFHTDDADTWAFVRRFGAVLPYRHTVKARHGARMYTLPFGLQTLYEVYGVTTPADARRVLADRRAVTDAAEGDATVEAVALATLGPELYELLVRHYTEKQWGRPCAALPGAILKRLPVRLTWDAHYFADRWQGLPADGYATLFRRMLGGAHVQLGVDFLSERARLESCVRTVVYSGPLDAYFDCAHGALAYRTLRFVTARHPGDVQGTAVVNWTGPEVPWTRTIEWAHFAGGGPPEAGLVTTEYPAEWAAGAEPYYPVRDPENLARYAAYRAAAAARAPRLWVGGRLGTYAYYDMHQAIAQGWQVGRRVARALADREV